jgi:hypothetical protein
MSWDFSDSSHGDGLMEGLDGYDDGSGSGLCNWDTTVYPGSGPSTLEVTPLLPALFLISSIVVTTLLELFGLEEEEEGSDLPSLRVQTPLYR